MLVAVVLLAAGAVRAAYSGQALPGTKIGDEPVGGQSAEQLRRTIARLADPSRRITLVGGGRQLQVSAGGGGLDVDVDATVDRALRSRRGSFVSPLLSLGTGAQVALAATVDPSRLRTSVARLTAAVDRAPYPGALTVDPDTLAVTSDASRAGQSVEQQPLTDRLRAALLEPRSAPVQIPTRATPAVSSGRVQRVRSDAEQYLRRGLRLTGAGSPYVVRPAALARVLALRPTKSGEDAVLGADPDALSALTAKVAGARNRPARSARISAPARGPILDGKGEVSWTPKRATVTVTSDGHRGRSVNVDALATRIQAALRGGEHAVAVPTTTTEAPVSRSAARKIDRVIGTFTTAYIAGQPRVTNIQRMARAIDQTVIAPGKTFSLNGLSGERTKAKGYVEAPFIAGNKIEPSVGGGVSQFSTTMYNAAYFAGLRIDTHQPHSLFIDRYPAGRESTLNWPDIDLRWTNDTDVPVYIRTYADAAGVTVTLYGNNGGRRVRAIPGARQPNPGGNFTITVTRVITDAQGRQVREPFTSKYANEVTDEAPQE